MINKKYELFKEPYIRKADYKYYGTKNIMIDFIISLLPVILAGWYQNGVKVFINNKSFYSLIYPLLFVILGGIFTFLIETLYFYFFDKSKSEYSCVEQSLKSYSIIPGILLAIILGSAITLALDLFNISATLLISVADVQDTIAPQYSISVPTIVPK